MLDEAVAVLDGVVQRATGERGEPALVRAEHIFKGPRQELFQVVSETMCEVDLPTVGERVRLVLWGGPEVYRMPIGKDYRLVAEIIGDSPGYRLGGTEDPPIN